MVHISTVLDNSQTETLSNHGPIVEIRDGPVYDRNPPLVKGGCFDECFESSCLSLCFFSCAGDFACTIISRERPFAKLVRSVALATGASGKAIVCRENRHINRPDRCGNASEFFGVR